MAELSNLMFDLDTRKVDVEFALYSETEPIGILLEDVAIFTDGGAYPLVIPIVDLNRPRMINQLV